MIKNTIKDIVKMNKNAVRGAFIAPHKKAQLIGRIEETERKDKII